jgi:drug/metabolite transporter (DMT)-like permease
MTTATSSARGIAAMLFATASYVVCDTFMKITTTALPPFEILFVRGIFAVAWCAGLVLLLGQWRGVARGFSPASLARAGFETAGVMFYIVALSMMQIADVVAIEQIAPLIFVLIIATIGREKIGLARFALIAVGFVGALLVAQPDAHGFSTASLLAFASALFLALRDVAGRKVSSEIPALVATLATNIVVLVSSGVGMVLTEDVVMPSAQHGLFLLASGFFVTLGHFGVFMAYRHGAPGVIAPFFYSFAVWAMLSGVIVFGELPNPLALVGIAAIVASGLGIILVDRQRRARTLVPVLPE